MHPVYTLSTQQIKELTQRGKLLRIAIPAPQKLPSSALAFARASLTLPDGVRITDAIEQTVSVIANTSGHDTLSGRLGAILRPDAPESTWTARIMAIVMTVEPAKVRHGTAVIQWACDVRIGDWTLSGGVGSESDEE